MALSLIVLITTGCQAGPAAQLSTATAQPSQTPALTQSPTRMPTQTFAPTQTAMTAATPADGIPVFSGEQALADVQYQVELGPRTPDSPAHEKIIQWLTEELQASGWEVEVQKFTLQGHLIRNVVARRGTDKTPWVMLGAHYDTRLWADQDPDPAKQKEPVPGADDGASGVAVLLGLARTLPKDLDKQVWLVFFDLEDQGQIPGWNWILGSTVIAQQVSSLPHPPDAVVVVDMVGDANLNMPIEQNSDPKLVNQIWGTAKELGYDHAFLPTGGYNMLDDHTPFLETGIPAVDIIDFDYPYWHTTEDTPDKVSANSLKVVGQTLLTWLIKADLSSQ